MKTAVIRIVIGLIIFSIGYFARDPTVGLSMLLVYCVGIFVGIISLLIEEYSWPNNSER